MNNLIITLTILISACKVSSNYEHKSTNNNEMSDINVKIEGVAKNAKLGAVVIENNSNVTYYIENLNEWSNVFNNKKIVVEGSLLVLNYSKADSANMFMSKMEGDQILIRNAKWKLSDGSKK